MNKAFIIIPDDGKEPEVQTNGVHLYTIINTLQNLQKGLAQILVKQAQAAVGNDPRAQEKYLDQIIKQVTNQNGINPIDNINLQ